jgi:hypothetical protein
MLKAPYVDTANLQPFHANAGKAGFAQCNGGVEPKVQPATTGQRGDGVRQHRQGQQRFMAVVPRIDIKDEMAGKVRNQPHARVGPAPRPCFNGG